MHKLIAMDMDGTLLKGNQTISEKTKEELLRVQSEGAKLILASGRPTTGMARYAKELEMDKNGGLLVSFNGSRVIDCETEEVLYDQSMTVEQSKAVLRHMKKFDVEPMLTIDDYLHVEDVFAGMLRVNGELVNIIEFEARACELKLKEVDNLVDFTEVPMNKVLTAGEPEYLKAHYEEMMEPFKDELNCMFTASYYFEYTAKNVDKANALKKVIQMLDYDVKDLIAFGDAQNDFTMIDYAGMGVAMGNAIDTVKSVANFITKTNEEDGIAEVLKTL